MKITSTPIHTAFKIKPGTLTSRFSLWLSMVCGCLFSLTSGSIVAQVNASVAPPTEISTEDYPGVKWKSTADYVSVLASERSNTAVKLADPNLQAPELGLYTGYDRMLSYMEQDVNNHLAIGEIAITNFNKVLAEAPGDAILKYMHLKDFQILYDALLPKLIKP